MDLSVDKNIVTFCHNDDNPIFGFGDVDFSEDEHRLDNICPQSKPPIFLSLSRNLLSLAEKLNFWSSIFW
jgi:hypothetical protein